MTSKELTEVAERHGKATPGPWVCDQRNGCIAVYAGERRNCMSGMSEDSDCILYDRNGIRTEDGWEMPQQRRDDAEFVAASWDDVRRLLGEVERLREALGFIAYSSAHKDADEHLSAVIDEARRVLK